MSDVRLALQGYSCNVRYSYGVICSAPWGPSKTWEFCLKGGMLRMHE